MMALVVICDFASLHNLYGVTYVRLVVMGKRELTSSAADVTCSREAI